MKRRIFTQLLGVALGALALGGGANAVAQDKVTVLLNYTANGALAPFYYGKAKGFFAAEGIDLTILEGRGSGPTIQAVASKNVEFGYADFGTMVKIASKGAPVKMVGVLIQKNPAALISLKEKNITKPEDVKGKTIIVTAGDAPQQLWTLFMDRMGLKDSDFKTVTGNPQVKLNAVISGQVDALVGFASEQPPRIVEALKKPVNAVAFADYGVNLATLGVLVHNDTLKDKPDLVKRFMRAATKSYEEGVKDQASQEASVDALLKAMPNAGSRATSLAILSATIPFYRAPATSKNRLFRPEDKIMNDSMDVLVEDGAIDKSAATLSKYYTSDFLP